MVGVGLGLVKLLVMRVHGILQIGGSVWFDRLACAEELLRLARTPGVLGQVLVRGANLTRHGLVLLELRDLALVLFEGRVEDLVALPIPEVSVGHGALRELFRNASFVPKHLFLVASCKLFLQVLPVQRL